MLAFLVAPIGISDAHSACLSAAALLLAMREVSRRPLACFFHAAEPIQAPFRCFVCLVIRAHVGCAAQFGTVTVVAFSH